MSDSRSALRLPLALLLGALLLPAAAQDESPKRVLRQREQTLAPDDAKGRLELAKYALAHELEQDAARLLIQVSAQDSEDPGSEAVRLLSQTLDYHLDDEGNWLPPEAWYPLRGYVKTRRDGWKQPQEVDPEELHELWAKEVLELVNAARKEHDLRPLRRYNRAEAAAQEHAVDMAERDFFSHTSPEGVTLGQRAKAGRVKHYGVGENIARGQKTPREVMDGWLNSPGHRANLLKPTWTKLGVGLAWGRNRKGEPELVWVQVFVNSKKPKPVR